MKTSGKILLTAVVALSLGVAAGSLWKCCGKDGVAGKVAVVDVQKVVASSKSVAEFRNEQQAKAADLQEFVNKSNEEISKAKDDKEKEELAQKYRLELLEKQQSYQEEDMAKLQEIDDNITKLIAEVSEANGYKQTYAKGSLIHGGDDITDMVVEALQ